MCEEKKTENFETTQKEKILHKSNSSKVGPPGGRCGFRGWLSAWKKGSSDLIFWSVRRASWIIYQLQYKIYQLQYQIDSLNSSLKFYHKIWIFEWEGTRKKVVFVQLSRSNFGTWINPKVRQAQSKIGVWKECETWYRRPFRWGNWVPRTLGHLSFRWDLQQIFLGDLISWDVHLASKIHSSAWKPWPSVTSVAFSVWRPVVSPFGVRFLIHFLMENHQKWSPWSSKNISKTIWSSKVLSAQGKQCLNHRWWHYPLQELGRRNLFVITVLDNTTSLEYDLVHSFFSNS